MTTLAILPIKTLDDAKTRLAEELDPRPRRALVEAMFSDVLVALRRATLIDQVLVVSRDHNAQRIAGGYGAMVSDDEDTGHNDAAGRGIARAVELGAERVLLVPGDTPLLDPVEIDALLTRDLARPGVLIVPDRHGTGTNALVLAPPGAMKTSFGPGSHDRHHRHAAAAGIIDGLVADERTRSVPVLETGVLMGDGTARRRVAEQTLQFALGLRK